LRLLSNPFSNTHQFFCIDGISYDIDNYEQLIGNANNHYDADNEDDDDDINDNYDDSDNDDDDDDDNDYDDDELMNLENLPIF